MQKAATKLLPNLEVIQREAADTGTYNIGVDEGKRRSNSSVMKGSGKLDKEILLI